MQEKPWNETETIVCCWGTWKEAELIVCCWGTLTEQRDKKKAKSMTILVIITEGEKLVWSKLNCSPSQSLATSITF